MAGAKVDDRRRRLGLGGVSRLAIRWADRDGLDATPRQPNILQLPIVERRQKLYRPAMREIAFDVSDDPGD
jgi:hypothetical protein